MHAKKACKKFMKNFLHTLCLSVIMLYINARAFFINERTLECVCVCYTFIWIDQIKRHKKTGRREILLRCEGCLMV